MKGLHRAYLFARLLRRVERRGQRLHAHIRAAYHDASVEGRSWQPGFMV
jgi:hypothetical protein